MKLRATLTFPDLPKIFREQVAKEVTAAMKRETRALEKTFEANTLAAGLGPRMAKTWNSRTYPPGKDVLGPAGQIWSKAPKAMKAFTEGASIRPIFGRMLAIPTPDGLRLLGGKRGLVHQALDKLRVGSVGRGKKRRVVVDHGIELAVVPLPRGGKAQAAIVTKGATYGQSGRVRRATAGRAALGLREQAIVLFWLVPRVTIKKRLDLVAPTREAQGRIRAALATAINTAQRSAAGQR